MAEKHLTHEICQRKFSSLKGALAWSINAAKYIRWHQRTEMFIHSFWKAVERWTFMSTFVFQTSKPLICVYTRKCQQFGIWYYMQTEVHTPAEAFTLAWKHDFWYIKYWSSYLFIFTLRARKNRDYFYHIRSSRVFIVHLVANNM